MIRGPSHTSQPPQPPPRKLPQFRDLTQIAAQSASASASASVPPLSSRIPVPNTIAAQSASAPPLLSRVPVPPLASIPSASASASASASSKASAPTQLSENQVPVESKLSKLSTFNIIFFILVYIYLFASVLTVPIVFLTHENTSTSSDKTVATDIEKNIAYACIGISIIINILIIIYTYNIDSINPWFSFVAFIVFILLVVNAILTIFIQHRLTQLTKDKDQDYKNYLGWICSGAYIFYFFFILIVGAREKHKDFQ